MHRRVIAWRRWLTGSVLALSLGCLVPTSARAYRTANDLADFASSEPVGWRQSTVFFDRADEPAPAGLPFGVETTALREAAQQWAALDCAGPMIANSGAHGVAVEAGDGINAITWAAASDLPGEHPSDTPAVTDVQYATDDDGNWEIVEADIYLNREIAWGGKDGADLTTVLTHELGHVLGLLHPCEPNGVDDAPNCDDGDYSDSIMFPLYDEADASLTMDDSDGYCSLYGKSSAVDVCAALSCESSPDAGTVQLNDNDAGARRGDAGAHAGSKHHGADFGAACDVASDCSSNLCIDDGEHGPSCTRGCGADAGTCPAEWRCASVDEQLVCVSPEPDSCAVRAPGHLQRASHLWLSAIGLLILQLSRRRTRRMRVRA